MKILFVSSGNRGGLDIICKTQVDSLREAGLEIDHFLLFGKGFIGYLSNITRLKRHLVKNNYDLIHSHFGLSGIVALFGKKNEKLIVSFMGDDILGSNDTVGGVKFLSKLLVAINKILANYFYDFIIVKSLEMKRRISTNRVKVIPNGVNLKIFTIVDKTKARKILNISDKVKLIIFVADPTRPEKNYSLAKSAVKMLNLPSIEFKAIHKLKQEELNLYYNAADIMVMSSFHEGSPNVIKEAMACNCPIVATDVGDIKWVFGETAGCYLTGYKEEDFAAKIKDALAYVKKKGRTKGRERIKELGLDTLTVAKEINSVYEGILK